MYNIRRNKYTAELVGLSFGDGGLTLRKNTRKVRFQLRGDLREEKEFYDSYVIPLFNKEVMFPEYNRGVGIVFNRNKNFYGLSIESVKIGSILNYLGIPTGVKKELYIPSWIKNNKKYIASFLKGYFDTDGSIFCEKNYSLSKPKYHTKIKIGLATTSKNLAEEMVQLLNRLQIKNITKKYSYKNRTWRDFYNVVIDGGINVVGWFDKVGSNNQKHITKYLIWKKHRFCPPYTTLKERRKILKGEINILDYYAGVPERSNGLEIINNRPS